MNKHKFRNDFIILYARYCAFDIVRKTVGSNKKKKKKFVSSSGKN